MDPLAKSLRSYRASFIRTSVLLFIQAILVAGTPYLLMEFFANRTRLVPVDVIAKLTEYGLTGFEAEAVTFAAALLFVGLLIAWLSKLEETSPLSAALGAMSLWRNTLLSQLFHGRLSYFETHSPHDLATRLSDDGITVELLLVSSLKAFAKSLPTLVLMLGALAFNSPVLAIAFFVTLIPFYTLASNFVRADWVRSKRSDQETAHYRHEIQHSLQMLASLKSLSVETEALEALELRSYRTDEQALLSRKARGSLAGTIAMTKHVLRAAMLVFAAYLMSIDRFTVGPFLMFVIYVELMPSALVEIARCVALTKTAAPALERLRGLAASLENEEETEGARRTSSLPFPDSGTLVFEDVALNTDVPAFSAEFEPGELIAVVGTQKSGRSSLGRLLNRLNDPLEGTILIGRTALTSFSLELLRRTVTVVDRVPYFMTTTVRENLALAIERETDLDDRSVNEALHAAGVDFVGDLPEKLETVIGESAYRLTESEAQRLGVARALLRSASRIFFFDEVTAGLEPSEARTIFEAAQSLAENGAIVFWVTRRADEAFECDRVVHMEPAGPVTIETHETLIATSDRYRKVLGLRDARINAPNPPQVRPPTTRNRSPEPTL
jgi:ABC-type multidrug transport system fused ATPase/permease subunit